MRLFKKSYDYKKDFLRKEFVLSEKRYFYFYKNQRLGDKDLTRKSQKALQEENNRLLNDPQLLSKEIETIKAKERFAFLKSQGYYCNSFEYLGIVEGTMSPEMETFLSDLTSKENVLLGIHRIQPAFNMNNTIVDILTRGLILTGHTNSGVEMKHFNYSDLNTNISYYANNKTIIKELMYANEYKNSVGSFLIEIPDAKLHSDDLIYLDENGAFRLSPKYIIGFVPTNERHHISTIIKASDLVPRSNSSSLNQQQSANVYTPAMSESLDNNLFLPENEGIKK